MSLSERNSLDTVTLLRIGDCTSIVKQRAKKQLKSGKRRKNISDSGGDK